MKSILMGGGKLFAVYAPDTLATLSTIAGLDPTPVMREEILAEPEKYRDVEVIFSTWGMPKFTEEEIFFEAMGLMPFAVSVVSPGKSS